VIIYSLSGRYVFLSLFIHERFSAVITGIFRIPGPMEQQVIFWFIEISAISTITSFASAVRKKVNMRMELK
jgi:hypothetical protein